MRRFKKEKELKIISEALRRSSARAPGTVGNELVFKAI